MTMWVFGDDVEHPVEEFAQWVDPGTGTTHPGGNGKAGIPGMVQVLETPTPDILVNNVHGSSVQMVEGAPTRVWYFTPRTEEEIAANAATEAARTARSYLLGEIYALEAAVTPRRLRDAVLQGNAWIADIDRQIAALRSRIV